MRTSNRYFNQSPMLRHLPPYASLTRPVAQEKLQADLGRLLTRPVAQEKLQADLRTLKIPKWIEASS